MLDALKAAEMVGSMAAAKVANLVDWLEPCSSTYVLYYMYSLKLKSLHLSIRRYFPFHQIMHLLHLHHLRYFRSHMSLQL